MSLLERTKSLLRTHRIFPKKDFGQSFMVDSQTLERLVSIASLSKSDTVLEIGAGLGYLTQSLAEKCEKVLAVEADSKLAAMLREQFKRVINVKVIEGSILKIEVPTFDKIVSIPPYNISSHLVVWLFPKDYESAVLIFQKEFADRLVAPVGSDKYGWLTVLTYYHAKVELLDEVPKRMFYPQPKVASIITCLNSRRQHPFPVEDENLFSRLVPSLFTQRNRKIRNAVLPYLRGVLGFSKETATTIAEGLPFHDERARELAPEDFGALANAIIN